MEVSQRQPRNFREGLLQAVIKVFQLEVHNNNSYIERISLYVREWGFFMQGSYQQLDLRYYGFNLPVEEVGERSGVLGEH